VAQISPIVQRERVRRTSGFTKSRSQTNTRRLSIGFLNQVFGFFAILCEPVCEVDQLIEERHGQFFERIGLRTDS
jgi:hypothetical protein